jgi:hypothetical protein
VLAVLALAQALVPVWVLVFLQPDHQGNKRNCHMTQKLWIFVQLLVMT